MYTLELDLFLRYSPPMSSMSGGVVLTRTLELPFVPYDGLRVYAQAIDECPDPMGFGLKDVVWDMDRSVFLASTIVISSGTPFAEIPQDIRRWLDRGWRLGSCTDSYGDQDFEENDSGVGLGFDSSLDPDETMHLQPVKGRPRAFNQLFRALIRYMVENYNSLDVAYAMDKLGRYVERELEGSGESNLHREWRDAKWEFSRMSPEEQGRWMDKTRRYPRFERYINEPAESSNS